MKITVEERQYVIRFRHRAIESTDHPRASHVTDCMIVDAEGGDLISSGGAYCSKRDIFSRAIGRKCAFERALTNRFKRPIRARFWAAMWAARKAINAKPWTV